MQYILFLNNNRTQTQSISNEINTGKIKYSVRNNLIQT